MSRPDAVVVGSGPNGLAAAITIARTGRRVLVLEAADTIGGGCRSGALTLPGYVHDLCSTVHPFAPVSPALRDLPLGDHGLEWVMPEAMFAHPFDDGPAAVVSRDVAETADRLGADAGAWARVFARLAADWPRIERNVLGPLALPRHPWAMARFGIDALQPAAGFARRTFRDGRTRALFAGAAAHGMVPLDRSPTAGVGIVLTLLAHVAGWPLPKGGAGRLTAALASYLRSLGGEIVTRTAVTSVDDLPPAHAVLCDVGPRTLLRIAGHRFPVDYRRALERYRYGPGVFKVDWALAAPVPWRNADCARAGTVHLGGSLEEIAASEREAWEGRVAERPYVLLVQPTLFDPSRAPGGRHVAWAYCHVPHGFAGDMLPKIEAQIERFAPGFRERVLARAVARPADLERRNANLVGGDIAGGSADLRQTFARPTWRTYSTPVKGLYLCSSSTPPGPGVHGMCGLLAAERALAEVLRE
ncbi:MAG: NAD(P)/FAD-dependent oxidoreductase [Acidimicrobiia bacterium]|nr:NAD(P)/FAD-dependent oxidoreductase [Acidimicrobiia bacterium]